MNFTIRFKALISSIVFITTIVSSQPPSLTSIPNWLKFPPKEHPDWTWVEVSGVDFDSKGNLFITSRGGTAPRLTVWNPDGTFQREFPTPAQPSDDAHSVVIDRANNDIIWWVLEAGCAVYKMDQSGKVLMVMGTPGQDFSFTHDPAHFSHSTDIAWDKEGNLYVSDGAESINSRLMKFEKNGKSLKTIGGPVGSGNLQFHYSHGLFITDDDRILVCDRNQGRIQVFDKNLNFITSWTSCPKPYDIKRDNFGNYWVVGGTTNRIDNIDINTGKVLYSYTGVGLTGNLHSLAMSPNGELIAGLHNGGVGISAFKINSSTTRLVGKQRKHAPLPFSLNDKGEQGYLRMLDASGKVHYSKMPVANRALAPLFPKGIYFVEPKSSSVLGEEN